MAAGAPIRRLLLLVTRSLRREASHSLGFMTRFADDDDRDDDDVDDEDEAAGDPSWLRGEAANRATGSCS